MGKVSAPEGDAEVNDRCPKCSYYPHRRDRVFIDDFAVWHVRCYQCGMEWVE